MTTPTQNSPTGGLVVTYTFYRDGIQNGIKRGACTEKKEIIRENSAADGRRVCFVCSRSPRRTTPLPGGHGEVWLGDGVRRLKFRASRFPRRTFFFLFFHPPVPRPRSRRARCQISVGAGEWAVPSSSETRDGGGENCRRKGVKKIYDFGKGEDKLFRVIKYTCARGGCERSRTTGCAANL